MPLKKDIADESLSNSNVLCRREESALNEAILQNTCYFRWISSIFDGFDQSSNGISEGINYFRQD